MGSFRNNGGGTFSGVFGKTGGFGANLSLSGLATTLAANFKNLVLLNDAKVAGTGNGLANAITRNAAANRLGGRGGTDQFVFAMAPGTGNLNRIMGMNEAGNDTILIVNPVFAALGLAGALAGDSSDRINHEMDTGETYYDSNGSASRGTDLLLARVDAGITLTAEDVLVI